MDLSNPRVDSQLKEHLFNDDETFFYRAFVPEERPQFYGDILWHWHDEFEFGYVMEGSIIYRTSQNEYVLEKGDAIFINTGVLHYLQLLVPPEEAYIHTQFLDRTFLAGYAGSVFDTSYIAPVAGNRQADAVPFYRKDAAGRRAAEQIDRAVRIAGAKKEFFELRLRSLFSSVWEDVFAGASQQEAPDFTFSEREDERLKKMIAFIRAHYAEKISVLQIASCIPVSERECYRLFQKHLGTSPVEFVISVRLERAQELLAATDKSVMEIALETGFSDSSYFGKLFRKEYLVSPGRYRKESRK